MRHSLLSLPVTACVVIATLIAGCAGRTTQNIMAEPQNNPQSAAHQPLCGGYTASRALNTEERALFDSVCNANNLQLQPLSVATQVVAGTNYRFECKDGSKEVTIVIFVPLPCYRDQSPVTYKLISK